VLLPYHHASLPCHRTLLFYLISYWALLPCHCTLLLAFFKYFMSPLHCCFVVHCHALLFCLINSYSLLTLLCRWRSLEQHQ
jgi:hypothetical protein